MSAPRWSRRCRTFVTRYGPFLAVWIPGVSPSWSCQSRARRVACSGAGASAQARLCRAAVASARSGAGRPGRARADPQPGGRLRRRPHQVAQAARAVRGRPGRPRRARADRAARAVRADRAARGRLAAPGGGDRPADGVSEVGQPGVQIAAVLRGGLSRRRDQVAGAREPGGDGLRVGPGGRGVRAARGQVSAQGPRDVPQRGHDRLQPAGHHRVAVAADRRAERGRGLEPLGEQDPGRLAVRQQVVGLIEQLEARARVLPLVTGTSRQRGDHVGERLEHRHHHLDGRVGQGLQLRVGLLGVREVALEDLQQDLLAHVEQVGHPGRHRVGDQRDLDLALRRADVGRDHRPDRVEPRAGLAPLLVLVENGDELAEVGVAPVAARALALLQDRVDGPLRRGQVGDRDQVGPAEVLGRGLGPRRADEQPLLPVLVGQAGKAGLDRAGTGARPWRSPATGARCRPRSSAARPGRLATSPSASPRSMPSGRSRNMKCRSACSPNGSSASWTPAG